MDDVSIYSNGRFYKWVKEREKSEKFRGRLDVDRWVVKCWGLMRSGKNAKHLFLCRYIYIYVCMYVKFVFSWRGHKWVTLALTWQPKHPWKENRDLLRSCKTRVRFPLRVTGGVGSDQIILLKFWVSFYLGTLLLGTPDTLKLKSILYKIN